LSAGGIPAAIAASIMAMAGRAVKLILVNPICQWWPQKRKFSDILQKQYDHMQMRVESDPALAVRLTAQGEILGYLARGLQHDLKLKVFVSQDNAFDMRETKRLVEHIGAEPVLVPTADHNILPWFCWQINPRGDLYRAMVERYRRTRPQDDMAKIEANAARDSVEMPRFWQQYPSLKIISDAM
jgi:hypothetical protein